MATRKTTTATAEPTPTPQTEATPTPTPTAETNTLKFACSILNTQISKNDNKRISITTNTTFPSFDESGNANESNIFGRARYTLVKECATLAPKSLLAYANSACMGRPIAKQFLGLLLLNATITIERTLQKAGTLREDGESIFESDTWTTKILKFKGDNNPFVQGIILNAITNGTIAEPEETTVGTTANPTWSFE